MILAFRVTIACSRAVELYPTFLMKESGVVFTLTYTLIYPLPDSIHLHFNETPLSVKYCDSMS